MKRMPIASAKSGELILKMKRRTAIRNPFLPSLRV